MGHEVHLAFLQGGPNLARLESSGVILHPLSAQNNYDPRIMLQLLSLIRWLKPDILQTWILQMDILGGLACRLSVSGVPWVLREPSSSMNWPKTIKTCLRLWTGRWASAIVANSAGGYRYWAAQKTRAALAVIPNCIPLEEIDRTDRYPLETLGIKQPGGVVLYAGRFDAAKNISTMVTALQQVVLASDATAVLCGDGSLLSSAKSQVAESGLGERFYFMGYTPHVWSIMKQAHTFVSVSRYEGCPNAVMEAIACGCPLVVSDIPAHREFLDEQKGLLVDPCDPTAIATAILQSLSKPNEARARAQRAKDAVATWSLPAIAQRYEQVYLGMLAKQEPLAGEGA